MEEKTLEDVIQRLNRLEKRAARTEGLQIFNPEVDSQQILTNWIS